MAALAAITILGLGGSTEAFAQVQMTLPVVQQTLDRIPPALADAVSAIIPAPAIPLSALVDANSAGAALDEQQSCLATAVYFESNGEPLEGQLAVAQVVINRAASGRYPASLCAVVKQKAQFSFVRSGRFPRIDPGCDGWRKAQAIARIASARLAKSLAADVLWYHANYVTPSWRLNLKKVDRIGAHIFYRG